MRLALILAGVALSASAQQAYSVNFYSGDPIGPACDSIQKCLDAGFEIKARTSIVIDQRASSRRVLDTTVLQKGSQAVACSWTWWTGDTPKDGYSPFLDLCHAP